jgi:hypothetical protein
MGNCKDNQKELDLREMVQAITLVKHTFDGDELKVVKKTIIHLRYIAKTSLKAIEQPVK